LNHEDTKTRRFSLASHLDDEVERVGRAVVDSAYAVHRALGPGLLESAYEACLRHELSSRGLSVAEQVAVPVIYKEIEIGCGFRLDLLVEDLVVVEVKAAEQLLPVHSAQLLTYLKLARKRLGFLINFNVPIFKEGVRRLAL
jgi:GxxExxY protein